MGWFVAVIMIDHNQDMEKPITLKRITGDERNVNGLAH